MQLRVIVPPDRTDEVRALFERDRGTAHLAVQPGAAVDPAGDLVVGDVAREAVDGLVTALRELGIDRDGGITMISVDAAVSSAARRAEERAPGDAADAVVWEQVIRTVDADSRLSVSYLAFLTIATMLAAIAIINDSAILVIGAMVLGPEFSPLAGSRSAPFFAARASCATRRCHWPSASPSPSPSRRSCRSPAGGWAGSVRTSWA